MRLTVKVRPQAEDSTNVCTLAPVVQALREAVGLPRNQHPREDLKFYPGVTRMQAFEHSDRIFARGSKWQIACEPPKEVAQWMDRWHKTGEGESFDFEVDAVEVTPSNQPLGEWVFPGFGGYYDRTRCAAAKKAKDERQTDFGF